VEKVEKTFQKASGYVVALACLVGLLGVGCTCGKKKPIVDAAHEPLQQNSGFGIRDTAFYRGESFTAGVSGNLVAVELLLNNCAAANDADIQIAIHSGSTPGGTPLGTATIPSAKVPYVSGCGSGTGPTAIFVWADLAAPVAITSGTLYSIWAVSSDGTDEYGWWGDNLGTYSGGQAFTNNGTSNILMTFDVGFRTWVSS
jgi:hypothetical protein